MITVEQLLMTAREEGASDVHITVGVPPRMRVNGRIANLDYPSLSETDCSKIIYSIMDDRQIEMFRDNKQIEFALSVPKAGRYRVSAFMQKGLPACAIRLVTDSVSAPGDIGVPKELIDICDSESGLVILGGVAGSGKSTTIASIIDYINENKCVHILTLEDPIEYVHTHKNAIVNQREVGIDVTTLNDMYLNDGLLDVQLLGRGFAWLDTGTVSSLLDAANFVEMIQNRQGITISAPEEIAFINGWISKNDLLQSAEAYGKSPYGAHLRAVAEGKVKY